MSGFAYLIKTKTPSKTIFQHNNHNKRDWDNNTDNNLIFEQQCKYSYLAWYK